MSGEMIRVFRGDLSYTRGESLLDSDSRFDIEFERKNYSDLFEDLLFGNFKVSIIDDLKVSYRFFLISSAS